MKWNNEYLRTWQTNKIRRCSRCFHLSLTEGATDQPINGTVGQSSLKGWAGATKQERSHNLDRGRNVSGGTIVWMSNRPKFCTWDYPLFGFMPSIVQSKMLKVWTNRHSNMMSWSLSQFVQPSVRFFGHDRPFDFKGVEIFHMMMWFYS